MIWILYTLAHLFTTGLSYRNIDKLPQPMLGLCNRLVLVFEGRIATMHGGLEELVA